MYLFFAFMLVACGDAATTETTTTTEGNSETTGTETGTSEEAATTTGTTSKSETTATTTSPFPKNEKMAFYCKKLYNKIIGSNYNVTTAETYTKVVDQIGAPTFKGKNLENAEVRMMSMNYTDKESTIKVAELTGNLVLPKKPEIVDYQPRGKNFFYDQGECGCVQVFVPSGGEAGGKAGGYALEDVFYYKKGKLVAVYDDKDQAVEMTEAHKTLSVENLTQFEAIKKIE